MAAVSNASLRFRVPLSLHHKYKCDSFVNYVRFPFAGSFVSRGKSKAARRIQVSDVGPDGKPLPQSNPKKLFPRLYKILLVNPDGSTYTIRQSYPHRILTLPVDLDNLSESERAKRLKQRRQREAPVFVEEEDDLGFDQSSYKDLIGR